MAASFPGSGGGPSADKSQGIPKMLLVAAVIGVLIVIVVAGTVLSHNHGGTSAGGVGQPADRGAGAQLGSEGPAPGRTQPSAGIVGGAPGPGGGPGAMGSGAGVGAGTPGSAGTRPGGASSGAPAGPSAGAPGTSP